MKPSWSDIVALGLLLLFAMVMANGWPSGDWGFGWGAIGAIGTLVTGGIASRIAYVQYQESILKVKNKQDHVLSNNLKTVAEVELSLRSFSREMTCFVDMLYSKPAAMATFKELSSSCFKKKFNWPEIVMSDGNDEALSRELTDLYELFNEKVLLLKDTQSSWLSFLEKITTEADYWKAIEKKVTEAISLAEISCQIRGANREDYQVLSILTDLQNRVRRIMTSKATLLSN